MPLQLPNLDDRRYNDLVTEALARLPTYSQEWTNYNPSDPGITLIELFAYLTDMLLYRLNRVTDNNLRKWGRRLTPKPGHVSVVIVPKTPDPQQPSADLIKVLLSYLDERRILTTKLHVTGPFYAHITSQLVIARNSDAEDEAVTKAINKSLNDLLNPLPSENGHGWPFGRDVFVSEVYESLEKIQGIDFITDVILDSVPCAQDDNNCVVANPIWHAEGNLVGLSIEEHQLPVFDHAEIVIASNAAFVTVNLSVSAQVQANADQAFLKRSINSAVRSIFHPGLGGPGPATAQPTNVFVSHVRAAIRSVAGVDAHVAPVVCIPSSILQEDTGQGQFIHVGAGNIVDWRTNIQLTIQGS